ncbi:hypothetical protein lerEdw1_018194 [Lerista edwardsae]|nr:hypothetical protein lerEdw1_018194 [Lerista edwardsae]
MQLLWETAIFLLEFNMSSFWHSDNLADGIQMSEIENYNAEKKRQIKKSSHETVDWFTVTHSIKFDECVVVDIIAIKKGRTIFVISSSLAFGIAALLAWGGGGSHVFAPFFPPLLFILPGFLTPPPPVLAAHKHKKHDTLQPCDTEYPIFVYEPAIRETNGIIDCGDCQKMFVVQQIMNSNLLLLVTDAVCDCKIFPPVLLQPKEVKYIFLLAKAMLSWAGHMLSC